MYTIPWSSVAVLFVVSLIISVILFLISFLNIVYIIVVKCRHLASTDRCFSKMMKIYSENLVFSIYYYRLKSLISLMRKTSDYSQSTKAVIRYSKVSFRIFLLATLALSLHLMVILARG